MSVREAAERVRAARKESDDRDGGYPATDAGRQQSAIDHCFLAEAYLELVPADSDTAITVEWLESVGFECLSHGGYVLGLEQRLLVGRSLNTWLLAEDADPNSESVVLQSLKTRGDVRRLCTVLGIELKETAE